jgi:zinc/manganese transport system permease protein
MNFADLDIVWPAFLAGVLVLTTHVPFGMRVLARNVIFADLAVAQIAGLGAFAATIGGYGENPLITQAAAGVSALCGGLLLALIEHYLHDIREACIGLLFVLAATAAILLMSGDTHAGEHLKDLLTGQILWVSTRQLIVTALLSGILLLLWRKFGEHISPLGFYTLFALAITASVQLVGVYLVFASLIVPALATYRIQRRRLPVAFGIGFIGYGLGLLLSVWYDLPSGAAIVWSMAAAGALVLFGKRA